MRPLHNLMRAPRVVRTSIVAMLCATVILAGCGDDDTSSDTSTPSSGYTLQQLSDALLTAEDLGEGWSETQRTMFETREPENPSIDPSLWCNEDTGASLVDLAGDQGSDVELQLGDPDAVLVVRQQAWTNASVDAYLTAVENAIAECEGKTWKDVEGNSYTLETTEASSIGDASINWSIRIEMVDATQPATLALQTVARFGEVIMVLQSGAAMAENPDIEVPNYSLIVEAAGEKMSGALSS